MAGKKQSPQEPQMPAAELTLVTPEMAMAWLEYNQLNRPLRDNHVKRIAGQIADGKWKLNGETIKIATTNDVLDGQHRLWAIIEAKTAVQTYVVRGIDKDAFDTIDTIRQVRSPSDTLALAGVSNYRRTIGTALHWLLRYQRKCIVDYRDPKNKIENSDVLDAWQSNKGMERAAERCNSLNGLVTPGVAAFVYYVISNRNPELAERMVHTLQNPAGIGMNDPFFRLRLYFTGISYRNKNPVHTIALFFKAANFAHANKETRNLTWHSQGATPEDFPKLEIT